MRYAFVKYTKDQVLKHMTEAQLAGMVRKGHAVVNGDQVTIRMTRRSAASQM